MPLEHLFPPVPAEKVVDAPELPAFYKMRRDPRYRQLLEMKALAGLLSRLALDDLEALAQTHGAKDLGTMVYGVAQDEKQFEVGHAVGFAEKVRDYVRDAVARAKHAHTRTVKASRAALTADRFASVPCGLQSPVSRTRPTLLVGEARAVRPLIDYVISVAAGKAQPPSIFHLWCSLGTKAAGLDPAAWEGNLHEVKALTPPGTDLLVVDNVLHGVRVKQGAKVRTRFERGTLAIKKLDSLARNHRIAVVAGYYWEDGADKDDVHYRSMKEWADSYRVERTASDLVVYDHQSGSSVLTIPLRRTRGAAAVRLAMTDYRESAEDEGHEYDEAHGLAQLAGGELRYNEFRTILEFVRAYDEHFNELDIAIGKRRRKRKAKPAARLMPPPPSTN